MPTAARRAAWAEWAAWTCKEPEGSLRSDVQPSTNKDPRRETGGGFFVLGAVPSNVAKGESGSGA